MPAWIEYAHLAAAATLRDNLISMLDANITGVTMDSFPGQAQITIACQFAFTEPDLDRQYQFSIALEAPDGTTVAKGLGTLKPSRPPDADLAFPWVWTAVQQTPFVATEPGHFLIRVTLEGVQEKVLPLAVKQL